MTAPLDPLFFTTFMYTACKVTGWSSGELLAHESEHGVPSLDASPWPGFRTLGQALRVADCRILVDGGTYITRSRSVAAGHFLRKAGVGTDVWLTCDDDLFATDAVIRQLVLACRATKGLVALPYANRDGGSMTFRTVRGPTVWQAVAADRSLPLRTVDRVGMGLVAMHRDFVQALDYVVPHFEDDYPAMFLEGVTDVDPETGIGVWTGEDYWLCALAEKESLPMHVLLNAPGEHAGIRAMLDVEGRMFVAGAAARDRMHEGIERANESQGTRGPLRTP